MCPADGKIFLRSVYHRLPVCPVFTQLSRTLQPTFLEGLHVVHLLVRSKFLSHPMTATTQSIICHLCTLLWSLCNATGSVFPSLPVFTSTSLFPRLLVPSHSQEAESSIIYYCTFHCTPILILLSIMPYIELASHYWHFFSFSMTKIYSEDGENWLLLLQEAMKACYWVLWSTHSTRST